MKEPQISSVIKNCFKIVLILLATILCVYIYRNRAYFDENSLANKHRRYVQGENNEIYQKESEILNQIITRIKRDDFQKLLNEKLIEYGSVMIFTSDFTTNNYNMTCIDDERIKDTLTPCLKTLEKKEIKARVSNSGDNIIFTIKGGRGKTNNPNGRPYCRIQYIPKTDSFNAYTTNGYEDQKGYIETNRIGAFEDGFYDCATHLEDNSNNPNDENNPNNENNSDNSTKQNE